MPLIRARQPARPARASTGPAAPVPAPPAEARGSKTRHAAFTARYLPAIIPAAVMTALGLWGLARYQDMGNDEVVSRWAALLPLWQLAHTLRYIDIVHGFYYLLLHGWMIFGTSPAIIRLPSVIGMAIAAILIALIGRRLSGSGWVGLFAGLIMAVTPYLSFYAQTARSYALVYACVLGQTMALLSALDAEKDGASRPERTRYWVLYGGLATVAAYLNEMALLVLAAHAVTVLLARYGREAIRHFAVAAAVAVVLATPLLGLSALQRGAISYIGRPGLHDLALLYHDYFGATDPAALIVTACAIVAVLPPLTWWRHRSDRAAAWWSSGDVSIPSVAVPLLLVPSGLLLVESRFAVPLYQDRYVLYCEAGAALLAGAGVCRVGRWLAGVARRPELILVPGLAVCVCVLVLQLGYQQRIRLPASRAFNYGGPAYFLAAHARPGDGVLFITSFYRKAELGYPDQFSDARDFALAVPPWKARPYQGINKPFSAVRPLLLSYRRIWVVGLRPSGRLTGEYGAESRELMRYYRHVYLRSYKGIWVSLWIRRQLR